MDADDDNDGIDDTVDAYPYNVPPAAVDDEAAFNGTAVTLYLTNNDSDKDGNLVPSTLTITSPPTYGTLINNNDGSATYTPSTTINGSDTFTYEVCDSEGLCDTGTTTIINSNIMPTVGNITAPSEPQQLGTTVTLSADYNDANGNDTLTATWNWGDGISDTEALASTVGTVTASHDYAEPGVYTVQLTIEDAAGETAVTIHQYVVIYDPTGGFVTGGGWIDSQAGWCTFDTACETATGRANFGFVSKYKRGANVPTGNTQFQFRAGDFDFYSDTYEWLVINQGGRNAQFQGSGMINDQPASNNSEYKFMIWATDDNPDTFRIKIWWEDNGTEHVVYDTGVNQEIGGGNIKVHQN